MTARPPRLAAWLVSRLLDRDAYEAVAGDLEEEFGRIHAVRGSAAATRWYWMAAARSIVTCRVTGARRVETRRMDFDGGRRVSLRDLVRPALRQFRDHPVYAGATAGTLALAIGIGGVTLTVVKRALLDPLPYRDDHTLYSVLTATNGDTSAVSPHVLEDLRAAASPLTAFAPVRPFGMAYAADRFTENITGNLVTTEYFSVLGVTPVLGRTWTAAEPDAVVISWPFWQGTLEADPNVIGRSIVIDGRARTIVGVMPREYVPPYWPNAAVWAPLDMTPLLADVRARRTLTIFARRDARVSEGELDAFLASFSRDQQQQYPDQANQSWVAVPLRSELVGSARPAVIGAGAAAALLFLIVAANIGGLSAAHAAATSRQVAIRAALGATRARLFSEQLVETLAVTLVGSLSGLWLAYLLTRLVAQYQPQFLGRLAPIALDLPTIALAFSAGTVIGIVASVVPRMVTGVQPVDSLRARGGTGDRRLARTRTALVMAQVAMALVLLVGAGLLIRTVRHLATMDLGFNPDGLFVLSVNLPLPKYQSTAAQLQFERDALERVAQLHGVQAVTASVGFPIVGGMMAGVTMKGDAPGTAMREIAYLSVAPNFMPDIGARIVAGRGLLPSDTLTAPRVVVINETMARLHWPQGNALGSEVYIGPGPARAPWITVVGVVADIRTHGPTELIRPAAFGSTLQYSWPRRHLTVRAGAEPPVTLAADLKSAIHSIDRTIAVGTITPAHAMLAERTGRHRLAMLALSLFGALALVLCVCGLYAVVALTSRLRQREYAIRMALGAHSRDVGRLVLRHALLIAGVGAIAGLAVAIGGTQILAGLLHGVSPLDRSVLIACTTLLLGLAVVAAWQPARVAARVDPVETLRNE